MSDGLEHVRIRLLKALACYEHVRLRDKEKCDRDAKAGVVDIHTGAPAPSQSLMPTHVPLWENDWRDDAEHMDLAVKEARALGQIDYSPPEHVGVVLMGPFVRITDRGVAWLRRTGNLPVLKDGTVIFARALAPSHDSLPAEHETAERQP